jgi:sulfur carrier protein
MIVVNGKQSELCAGDTLTAALARLEIPLEGRGIAVAVDGEVVPRAQWPSFALPEHACVEVLGAMQGG